ncbi:MAG TPA: hypothetical protein VHL79_18425 [Ramlibacter sp.]|jgi:hypothetical protein|nr:hypothetical protein [Ramlibacter sp.]
MAAWKNWLNSRPLEWQIRPPHAGVETVRRQLLAVLDDCHGFECDRLRWRVHTAERPQELWLLRDAVYQVVASQHCQAQAAERINQLVPVFQSVLPERMLTRV